MTKRIMFVPLSKQEREVFGSKLTNFGYEHTLEGLRGSLKRLYNLERERDYLLWSYWEDE